MRTWVEIRLDHFDHNLRLLRRQLEPGVEVLLPIKANAYGHGLPQIAQQAEKAGVRWFGVASADEAVAVKEAVPHARVLLFGPLPPDDIPTIRSCGATPTLCSLEEARAWSAAGNTDPLSAHVEIDTGMERSGVDWRQASRVVRDIAALPGVRLDGIYTHFASAESDPEFTVEQWRRFESLLQSLASGGIRPPIVHASNSAALFRNPETHGTMVRPGIAAYGIPGEVLSGLAVAEEFRPVLSWFARVVQVKQLEPGDTVSYGRTFRAKRAMTIALLGVGYADGFPRTLSNCGRVLLGGKRCRVLGAVCMDLIMVDVTGAHPVAPGDRAVLVGSDGKDRIGIVEVARRAGTISYEVLTRLGPRVARRFRDDEGGREA